MRKKKSTAKIAAKKKSSTRSVKAAHPARGVAASVKKRVAKTAKKVTAAAAHPEKAVRRAAASVHSTAVRARGIGATVATAGELIQQTADFVDSVAQRSVKRSKRTRKQP